MKPQEWGGLAALVTAVGALLRWGGSLLALLSGASKLKIDEGESVFKRASDLLDRQARRIESLEKENDDLRGRLADCLRARGA